MQIGGSQLWRSPPRPYGGRRDRRRLCEAPHGLPHDCAGGDQEDRRVHECSEDRRRTKAVCVSLSGLSKIQVRKNPDPDCRGSGVVWRCLRHTGTGTAANIAASPTIACARAAQGRLATTRHGCRGSTRHPGGMAAIPRGQIGTTPMSAVFASGGAGIPNHSDG